MSKKDSIRLSEKHGVNPSLLICTLCGQDIGVALLGKLKDDAEAPKHICNGEICEDCRKKLEEEKVRCFVDFSDGRWVKLNDEDISESYLKKVKDLRWIPIPHENFIEIFSNIVDNEEGN